MPEYIAASRLRFFDDEGALLPDEYRAQPPLVPVIEVAADDDSNDADVPVLNRTEVRPAG